MIQLAHTFAVRSPTERREQWRAFEEFILSLADQGWSRGDIYNLLTDVEKDEANQFTDEILDALYDYETTMIGHCGHDCIVRLPGEPEDEEEFLEYVYGDTWKKRP